MKIRVEKTHNYTVMSNYHLFDKRLSFKAKGLLSFMLAVPDTWEFSIKGLAAMAKDGVDSVAATLKEMEKYGYVSRRQIRNEKGSFKDVEYTIYECPIDNGNGGDGGSNNSVPSDSENGKISEENERTDDKAFSGKRKRNPEDKKKKTKQAENRRISGTQPNRENPVSVKKEQKQTEKEISLSKNPNRENPVSGFPCSGNPDSGNPPQVNTNISNILKGVNTNHIKSYPDTDMDIDIDADIDTAINESDFNAEAAANTINVDGGGNMVGDYSRYESIIRENIGYDDTLREQCTEAEMEQVNFMVQIMTEIMVSPAKSVRIGRNELPAGLVKGRFMSIWYEDILAVLRSIQTSATRIKYIRNYYLTALYYSNHTENIKIQQNFKNSPAENKKTKSNGYGNFGCFSGRTYDDDEINNLALKLMEV